MTGPKRGGRRVRAPERYRRLAVGRVQLLIRARPTWQGGVATAKAFAHNLNAARDFGLQIRARGHDRWDWLPRASWYSAWRAAEAILRPSLHDGRIARKPWFLSPESARRFERFSAVHGVHFATGELGIPMVAGDDARPVVIQMLYEFFESRARDRLKRCAACPRWFADETRNRGKRWCDEACHRRGWNRAARRAARHAQYAKKGADR